MVVTYCKLDVYILRFVCVPSMFLNNKRLVVRHFGSQRVVDALLDGRLEPEAARAMRPRRPFDSPHRLSGSKAVAAASSSVFSVISW
jgi:hypothetical protein